MDLLEITTLITTLLKHGETDMVRFYVKQRTKLVRRINKTLLSRGIPAMTWQQLVNVVELDQE